MKNIYLHISVGLQVQIQKDKNSCNCRRCFRTRDCSCAGPNYIHQYLQKTQVHGRIKNLIILLSKLQLQLQFNNFEITYNI